MPPAHRVDPAKPIPPGRLPKLRHRLAQMWASDAPRQRLFAKSPGRSYAVPFADRYPTMYSALGDDEPRPVTTSPSAFVPEDVADRFCTRMQRSLTAADLYWVSEEYTDLAIASGTKLPDLSVHREDLPAPHGLMMFAKPFYDITFHGVTCHATAVGWCLLDGGVWVTMYSRTDQLAVPRAGREQIRDTVGPLWPMSPGSGAPFRDNLQWQNDHARQAWSPVFAAWLLIQQPNLTEVAEAPAERDYTRSYARAHGGRTPNPVRVVDIRHHAPRDHPGTSGSTGRKLTVRSIVGEADGGFWRDQAYGPNWSLRRRQWILPFERGPKDAPLRTGGVELVRRLR